MDNHQPEPQQRDERRSALHQLITEPVDPAVTKEPRQDHQEREQAVSDRTEPGGQLSDLAQVHGTPVGGHAFAQRGEEPEEGNGLAAARNPAPVGTLTVRCAISSRFSEITWRSSQVGQSSDRLVALATWPVPALATRRDPHHVTLTSAR